MINIQKLIEEANENGYQGDKASAKVCQDIVLKVSQCDKENAKSLVNLGKNIFFTEVYFDKNTKTVYI